MFDFFGPFKSKFRAVKSNMSVTRLKLNKNNTNANTPRYYFIDIILGILYKTL